MGEISFLLGDLITTYKPCSISYTDTFLNVYLYFLNNSKDIKDHIQADMISCKIFFQLRVTVFKEKLNLQLPLIFYSSIRFVFETVFISKHITKFNVFSYMILQFRFKTVRKISKTCCMTLNSDQVVLLERSYFVLQRLGQKLLKIEKDMKIKHSLLSPLQSLGELFL